MLKKRIIPVVLFSHGWLVQTENFKSFRFLVFKGLILNQARIGINKIILNIFLKKACSNA